MPTAENAKIRRSEDTKLSCAFAATRFARQGVRESQMQAALDHELFAFAIVELPGGRPKAGGGGPDRQLRIFGSSYLRVFYRRHRAA